MYITVVGDVDSNVQDWVSKNINGRIKMLSTSCPYYINYNPDHEKYDAGRDTAPAMVKITIAGCWIESQSIKMTSSGDLVGGDKFSVTYDLEVKRPIITLEGFDKVFGTNDTTVMSSCTVEFKTLKEFSKFISNGFLRVDSDVYDGITVSAK